ncbi:MAG: Rne/Rng family ribonuclease [Acidimicrobiia bacterium]|nr:Rne/Rng family ribonuclease [Acidimicrobiia bacterium]
MSDVSESGGTPADRTPNEPATRPAPAKPKIGDSRPAPVQQKTNSSETNAERGGRDGSGSNSQARRRRRRRGGGKGGQGQSQAQSGQGSESKGDENNEGGSSGGKGRNQGQGQRKRSGQRRRGGKNRSDNRPAEEPVGLILADNKVELDEADLKNRRGRQRKGRPVGRYLMVVSKQPDATHIAILEGRTLIEYYVSRPSDQIYQIHGNIYLGRVQNVLPGMEAAFVDIGTPKNAVIYRGDVQYDKEDFEGQADQPKIEQMLKARQSILCQVTKNPIAHKGARLTTEVSLPGRFVVLVPNSDTYGISKRLPDDERRRLRQILDRVRPAGHGLIVRTAAENVTAGEIERDVAGLVQQWQEIEALAKRSKAPTLLYQEPDMSVRVIREEFNKEYRGVVIDDQALYGEVAEYVSLITPALADRVEYYDSEAENISLFERFHVHEQLHKALDKKVWLPSGGSLIIESTEALTVIDVNTGKNVGSSNLEDTVFRNNLEAAEGIAQQLRLRDIGGIIVIDFVDMENKKNRDEVMRIFRAALSRDKTRTQVFDISELGLAEMTRKRIGEGLLESLSQDCPHCEGRGLEVNATVLATESTR